VNNIANLVCPTKPKQKIDDDRN